MADFGTPTIGEELAQLTDDYSYLKDYLDEFSSEYGEYPLLIEEASGEYESERPNVIYEPADGLFVHIFGERGQTTTYEIIEPRLSKKHKRILEKTRERILDKSGDRPAPVEEDEFHDHLDELLEDILIRKGEGSVMEQIKNNVVPGTFEVSEEGYHAITYHLHRDIVGLGPLNPVMEDSANEDIHVIGPEQCHVDHAVYGMVETSVNFGTESEFDNWLRNMGERIDHPMSDSDPIIDATLPDGSRLNVIYSNDVSIEGPSLTIRQGDEVPLSILQITKWGTLSPMLSAYLWICLENERTVFVVGETASGKTTTLNSIMSFIPRDSKNYTAEDTAEVSPPHNTWQRLLTREGKGEDDPAAVDMFDLVAAALRSRPEYIIVGEVRGAEAQMAFQAAQTGHPVMLTFHASDIVSMIQRFTSNPINVPETFMDNADVCLFQNRVKQGNDVLRRVTSVTEIEGYSDEAGGVVTREVFTWDSASDEILFNGMNNSYILEDKIATLLGYEDTTKIYDDLKRRAEIIERLIENDVLEYHEVNDVIADFQRDGVQALPIDSSDLIE